MESVVGGGGGCGCGCGCGGGRCWGRTQKNPLAVPAHTTAPATRTQPPPTCPPPPPHIPHPSKKTARRLPQDHQPRICQDRVSLFLWALLGCVWFLCGSALRQPPNSNHCTQTTPHPSAHPLTPSLSLILPPLPHTNTQTHTKTNTHTASSTTARPPARDDRTTSHDAAVTIDGPPVSVTVALCKYPSCVKA